MFGLQPQVKCRGLVCDLLALIFKADTVEQASSLGFGQQYLSTLTDRKYTCVPRRCVDASRDEGLTTEPGKIYAH